ncbi:hypothetical protein F4781DRAFT_400928 [Annulohypoxylon bovei var. microspora]|nr:hypothetical protein F4781DRAFT_400928 [Annulohypoxylon bovei var. microspora]
MGFYSFLKDDRLIAVSLGLSTVGFLFGMRTILEYYRDEAEIKPTPPKTQYITQETEDSLKSKTLESLLGHYNFAIRDTALKIIAGRAVNDSSAIYHLLWGITREDYEERMEALRALTFAMEDKDTFQEPLTALNTPKAYSALVRSLELCLGDVEHEKLDDPLYDEYYLRDIGERRCLMLVSQLVNRYGVQRLVEAGFVEKWLAKQPWGDGDEERQNNFSIYSERRKNRLSDICFHLTTAQIGRKALYKAKLSTKKRKRRDRSDIKVVLEICINEDERDGASRSELVPRVNDQSAEEQRLRRRHREAMVLNDGTHSLGRSDIIEREHDSNS